MCKNTKNAINKQTRIGFKKKNSNFVAPNTPYQRRTTTTSLQAKMIYPNNFEQKIGFNEIRTLLHEHCLSTLGREQVDSMEFSTDTAQVNRWLAEVREFRRIQEGAEPFPLDNVFDVRASVARIRLEGTYMEESELFDLKRSL